MKEILQELAAYNKWANDRVIEVVASLPSELIDRTVPNSFPSLRLTLLHLWETEFIWWQRLHLAENIVSPAQDKAVPVDTIFVEWKKQSSQWQQWMMDANDIDLNHVFAYRNSKREEFKQPVYQVLLQVFNHATYHRGQVVTMFHHLGIEDKPHTDFVLWCRGKK